ncbi:hypothetical protein CLOM621_07908 [Clostridium sp. M62/1]|nr:hypothetical protein CLOM621_07908 [Clostridium sp. M62/1]
MMKEKEKQKRNHIERRKRLPLRTSCLVNDFLSVVRLAVSYKSEILKFEGENYEKNSVKICVYHLLDFLGAGNYTDSFGLLAETALAGYRCHL